MSEELLLCPNCNKIPRVYISGYSPKGKRYGHYVCTSCGLSASINCFAIEADKNRKLVFRDGDTSAARNWNNAVRNLVKVTRCRDCEFYAPFPTGKIFCENPKNRDDHGICLTIEPEHFCSWGKPRKESSHEE